MTGKRMHLPASVNGKHLGTADAAMAFTQRNMLDKLQRFAVGHGVKPDTKPAAKSLSGCSSGCSGQTHGTPMG